MTNNGFPSSAPVSSDDFPGEEPASVKPPEVAAKAILERLLTDAKTGERVRVEA